MWLKTEHVDDVVLLVPTRSVIGAPDLERIENSMRDVFASGRRKVLLDLENVQILTSLAMRGLLALQNEAKQEGVFFVLCNADRIAQVPEQFWIHRAFTLLDSREAGLRRLAEFHAPGHEVPHAP